ncbi:MAG: N-acetylglucosamine-6-phosphate deacetylase [Pseudomonadota bacterium]
MPGPGDPHAISAPALFDGKQFLREKCVIVSGARIEQVLPLADCPAGIEHIALGSGTLAPGLIDLQVNGGGDLLFVNSPCADTVASIYRAHRALGTTGMLPTAISETAASHRAAVAAVVSAQEDNPGILGIHLEGPFCNPEKHGAHRPELMRGPSTEDIDWLCSLGSLRVLITLAPEQLPGTELQQLVGHGLIVWAGHTQANYLDMVVAADHGLTGATHLYNAMSQMTAREPGVVGAALALDSLYASVIADGHHVHSAAITLALSAKPAGRLLLVSDAMAPVGGSADSFELYGETVTVQDGALRNANGALAGSAICLMDAVRFMHQKVGAALDVCLRMASTYPARVLGMEKELGGIEPGMRADLVHFEDDFRVTHTWLAGEAIRHA